MRRLLILLGLAVLASTGAIPVPASSATAIFAAGASAPTAPAGARPLAFELNIGQTDASVQFQAALPGGTAFFTHDGVVLALDRAGEPTRPPRPGLTPLAGSQAIGSASAPHVLNMTWLDADPAPVLTGTAPLPGHVNYLRGNDPAHWYTNVPVYQEIRYQDLYPGVELRYTSEAGRLKSTYILAPHGDLQRLRWRYVDCGSALSECGQAAPIRLDEQGIVLVGASGTGASDTSLLQEAAPVAWQDVGGVRVPVNVRYRLDSAGAVGFDVGAYDPAQPLFIDPTLSYSTYLGGAGDEELTALAIDAGGNIYSAGYSTTPSFPATPAPVLADHNARDILVVKLDPTGRTFLYETYIQGELADWAFGIAASAAGNAYLTGLTESLDFPVQNPIQATLRGPRDVFVLELSSDGDDIVYATYLGGSAVDTASSIALDAAGQVYIAGYTNSPDFPVTNALQPTYGGGAADVFVAKLNAQGSALVYATYLGGSDDDSGGIEKSTSIAVDAAGDVYLTGGTLSRDFPVRAPLQATPHGQDDVFVTALNAAGTDLIYSTYLGGSGEDAGASIKVDGAGNAYLTGLTDSPDFPTHLPYQASYGGGTFDAFVTQLTAGGAALGYSTYLGAEYDERGRNLALDWAGNAYITGYVDSYAFPQIRPVQPGYGGGIYDAFVTRLNAGGTQPLFSTYLGGNADDYYESLAVDPAGTMYLSGATSSSDWPLAGTPVQDELAGGFDGVISVISLQEQAAPNCATEFSDVPAENPFYSPIHDLACRQIVSGYDDGTFRPGGLITRGQMAKIVANSAGMAEAIAPAQQTFADVPPSQPFWLAIERLARAELISGYTCGGPNEPCDPAGRPYFRPNALITRGQLAKIVALAAGDTQPPGTPVFADVPADQPFFRWIGPLAVLGVISGYQCGAPPAGACGPGAQPYFLPGNAVTRAQASKMVANSFFLGYQAP